LKRHLRKETISLSSSVVKDAAMAQPLGLSMSTVKAGKILPLTTSIPT
jgi:hypothetical protein